MQGGGLAAYMVSTRLVLWLGWHSLPTATGAGTVGAVLTLFRGGF